MTLTDIFLPWVSLRQARLESKGAEALARVMRVKAEQLEITLHQRSRELAEALAQIAKFDRDGNGRVGGGKRRVKA